MTDAQSTPETDPGPPAPEPVERELKPGFIVFYDAAVFGDVDQVHVGLVIHAADGRVRVKPLGLAVDSADFPAEAVRLSA